MTKIYPKYPRTVAALIYFGGSIILSKRMAKTDPFYGLYGGVGGKMEKGEKPQEAISRETYEEIGIWIPPSEFRILDCVTEHPSTDKLFLFDAHLPIEVATKVIHAEPDKHGMWQMFTPEWMDLNPELLMPGLRNLVLT